MLQKVFDMFVDIPENLALSIPGLKDPSSLPHFKKVREKIKNKLKVARAQLKSQQEIIKKDESFTILNDNFVRPDKNIKEESRIPKNIVDDNHMQLAEKSKNQINFNRNDDNNSVKLSNFHSFSDMPKSSNSSIPQSRHYHSTCTITSSDIDSKDNYEISPIKSNKSLNLDIQKSNSSSQIMNESKYLIQ